jgi:hypothetical protein
MEPGACTSWGGDKATGFLPRITRISPIVLAGFRVNS